MSRSVILACSATKRSDVGEISAIARYDGPAWRTLRANLTCSIEPPFALSALYGLISAYREIPDYDRRMTPVRAAYLETIVADQLAALVREGKLRGQIFFFGGELYRELMERARNEAEAELERPIPITWATGGIGEQLGQLKAFLRSEA